MPSLYWGRTMNARRVSQSEQHWQCCQSQLLSRAFPYRIKSARTMHEKKLKNSICELAHNLSRKPVGWLVEEIEKLNSIYVIFDNRKTDLFTMIASWGSDRDQRLSHRGSLAVYERIASSETKFILWTSKHCFLARFVNRMELGMLHGMLYDRTQPEKRTSLNFG